MYNKWMIRRKTIITTKEKLEFFFIFWPIPCYIFQNFDRKYSIVCLWKCIDLIVKGMLAREETLWYPILMD